MVEKIITLENISLIDFFGVENKNIKELALSFPKSKIISRGNEIRIIGESTEILKINEVLNLLIQHYHTFGKISQENISQFIYNHVDEKLPNKENVLVYGSRGFVITPKTVNQYTFVKLVKDNDMVFALGSAGTGKTYISVALAIRALKNKTVNKIIITRPAVESGENLGFLPGDLNEKLNPYLRPIYDALNDMIPLEKLKHYIDKNIIEIAPLAYMRGRTLKNAFVLLDEAQNTTPVQMKMFLTRMGSDSKVIITGDTSQIDLPKNQKSGLVEAVQLLKNVNGIGFITLSNKDVMRHMLVSKIIEAYEKI